MLVEDRSSDGIKPRAPIWPRCPPAEPPSWGSSCDPRCHLQRDEPPPCGSRRGERCPWAPCEVLSQCHL